MIQPFKATVRLVADLEDLADEMRYAKEFTFGHPSELIVFMDLVEEARARARLLHAHASNTLQ